MVCTSMVECQWDSVVPSPYSPTFTGLELTFMGVTRSNSGLFRAPGFIVSPVGKGERRKKKEKGRKEKAIEKGWKEGRKDKKDQRKDKKKEF